MYKLLVFFIFSLTLFADNPKVYPSLGDIIYNNLSKIQSLKKLDKYEPFIEKIDEYSSNVKKAKKFGFEVESGNRSNLKYDYLEKLRELVKINDEFFRTAKSSLKSAIETEDNSLFIGIVNSGLIDTRKNKNAIMNYYYKHKNEINPDGVIQTFIDEAYIQKNKKRYVKKTKKEREIEHIKRIREKDRLKQRALEDKLSKEANIQKEKIRKEQEKELFN